MEPKKVFIDGSAGTTGLRIHERLAAREDITLLSLSEAERKSPAARKSALNEADIAFLCLPDAAAVEAVSLLENPDTVVLDTSTAHRTNPDWIYGFPELSAGQCERIRRAKRIAVPGCHASGFVALIMPLVQNGILPATARLSCHSLTGYSGGGKKMIAEYEAQGRSPLLDAPRQYALTQNHKHLREMQVMTGLCVPPVFCPVVADYYSGMLTTVGIFAEELCAGKAAADICAVYGALYNTPFVRFCPDTPADGFLPAGALSGFDGMQVRVSGNNERILLTACFDNLGKGASGAAVECMNLCLGVPPETGLDI